VSGQRAKNKRKSRKGRAEGEEQREGVMGILRFVRERLSLCEEVGGGNDGIFLFPFVLISGHVGNVQWMIGGWWKGNRVGRV